MLNNKIVYFKIYFYIDTDVVLVINLFDKFNAFFSIQVLCQFSIKITNALLRWMSMKK